MYTEYYIEAQTVKQLAPKIIPAYDLTFLKLDMSDVYKLEITRLRASSKKIEEKEKFCIYVADKIKSMVQWCDDIAAINNDNVYYPPIGPIVGKRDAVPDRIVNDISLNPTLKVRKHIYWHTLNPNKDIVVNRNFQTIYPAKTHVFPNVLANIFRSERLKAIGK